MKSRAKNPAIKSGAVALTTFLGLAPAANLLAQTVAADPTSPRIATNQEANDVPTKLGLIEQEVQMAQQEAMYSNLLRQ